jgi:hypothetical protein
MISVHWKNIKVQMYETGWEKFKYTSGVMRSHQLKKDRQYNGQKKKVKQ